MAEPKANGTRKRGRWKRRLAWTAAALLAAALAVAATVDWWLPALATRIAGAEYRSRETRFNRSVEWNDLSWSDAELGLAFHAERARIDAPTRILRNGLSTEARIDGWTLTITPGAAPDSTDAKPFGWPELVDALHMVGEQLERRLNGARLTDGHVIVAGEDIELREIEVVARKIGGRLLWRGHAAKFDLDLAANRASATWDEQQVRAELDLNGRDRVAGVASWAENPARFEAEFADGEWVPRRFALTGADWRVPAERIGLAGKYAELTGSFSARRDGDDVAVDVSANARPLTEDLPELKVVAAATAREDLVRLEKLEVSAPWLEASLSEPLQWRPGEGLQAVGEPVFAWKAELAPVTANIVAGSLSGSARLIPGEAWRVAWEAVGSGLAWEDLRGVDVVLRGESTAERTSLAEAELRGADGMRLAARGVWRHAEQRIEDGSFAAESPGAALRAWLPEELSLGRVSVQGKVAGEPRAPAVDATISAETIAYAGWMMSKLDAAITGNPAEALRGRGRATTGEAWFDFDATWTPERVVAETLTLHRADGRELRLTRPATYAPGAGRQNVSAEWAGDESLLRAEWTELSSVALVIQNLDTAWLADWRGAHVLPDVEVRRVEITGGANADGWAEGSGEIDLVWTREAEAAVWMRAAGSAGAAGLTLTRLEAGQGGETLAGGGGVAPWRLRLAGGRTLAPVKDGAWSLRLDSRPEATVWEALAKWAGIALERPGIALALSGPAEAPSGHVELVAGRIGLRSKDLPDGGLDLRQLDAAMQITRGEVRVEHLRALVDGQRVEADGRLVLGEGDWERLAESPVAWLRDHAEAQIRVPDAQVAALARYLPTLLAPQGVVRADLRLSPGANLDGKVRLSGASTRPIGSFGVLQEIEVELVLAGQELRVGTMRAMAGGQAVSITGGARRAPGRMPLLDLRVQAERFPLVRKPGLLLRGDIDLAVKTAEAADGSAGRTRVTGVVRLRDSLFLSDIRPLIASDGGSAAAVRSRPPYFSVEAEPLSEWEVDLRVTGDRFLRMRTPVFEGTGSAGFDLEGTLREPRASGEFRVDRGSILFPFANFAVQEGAVRLSKADPFTPVLDFRATGRRLGYDLRLELNGTANSPQLQFYSSPPLEAETVVLMVTAGAAPSERDGASTSQRLVAVGAYVGRDLLRTLGVGGADEDRLSLSTGEKVSRQGRETYGFDFRLTDKWSLTGEYDEFDAYNVGLKRRLRQAESTPAETEKNDDAR